MIDKQEIIDEINRLEHNNTSYANCEKLSILYTVLDHFKDERRDNNNVPQETYIDSSITPSSEFERAFLSCDLRKALAVLGEHMELLKVMYPLEYKHILNKLLN